MDPTTLDEYWLWYVMGLGPHIAGVAMAALAGDDAAKCAVCDYLQEHPELMVAAGVTTFNTKNESE